MNWRMLALCKHLSTDLFYLERGEEINPAVVSACSACPVKEECLEWALKHEMNGYWGGTSGKQRQKMRKELNIKYMSCSGHLAASNH